MFAITNGKVFTITQGVLENGTVVAENGRIAAIGEKVDIPESAQVFDATGKVVLPGLIDAHCHVGIFPDGIGRQYDESNETTDPITPHLRALDAINPDDLIFEDLVQSGVTTVLTGPGSGNLIGGQCVCLKTVPKPDIEQMVLLEPAGMKMALGENPRHAHGERKKMPSTRMGNAAVLRSALVDAQGYARKWRRYDADLAEYQAKLAAGESNVKAPEPPARDLKLEALGKVLSREMKARVHAHRADDMLTAIRIAEEFGLDITLEHATEGHRIADKLAAKGVPVTAGPIFLFFRAKHETRNLTPENPAIMARAGVKVAIQTDATWAVRFLTINAALAVREGMPEEEALRAITINPAEIIGVDDRVGSLEVGKDADIVVFSGHPFDFRSVTELVLVDGAVAYRRKQR